MVMPLKTKRFRSTNTGNLASRFQPDNIIGDWRNWQIG